MSTTNTNDIEELRNILFKTMEDLRAGKMDVQKAKAISDISQTIINSAKVELEFNKGKGSRFFVEPTAPTPTPATAPTLTDQATPKKTQFGTVEKIGNRTIHKLG